MKIKEILKKVANGEELTAEEKTFLGSYDPATESAKLLADEDAKLQAEKTRADTAEAKLAEIENADLSELEKTKAALTKAEGERDSAKNALATSERNSAISTLASKHNFRDAKYLDYLANSKNVDLKNDNSVTEFMKGLESNSPELFNSSARPGGGTGGEQKNSDGDSARLKELMGKSSLTVKESIEAIRMHEDTKEAQVTT